MNILDLFVRTPGDFLFFILVLVFSLASFFMSVGLWRRKPQSRVASRYMLAGGALTLSWGVLLPVLLFVIVSGQNPDLILPALERAIMTISLVVAAGSEFSAAGTGGFAEGDTLK
ncbi:MAG: hypothetical protein ACPG7F_04270, partial [Aggregatilineales bacterium]